MRPGQNKRIRGRNNNTNRKGPNPLTRSFESNGPDVKIRGTAHHIGEKYLQLARDAHSSGDPVRAESYLQHAEHYFRVIAAAQQAQLGYNRPYGEQVDLDDDDDGDEGSMPDRFASPTERATQQAVPERQGYQGGNGGERRDTQPHAQNERAQGDRGHNDRNQGDRGYDNRNGRSYDNRGNQDRGYQDRSYQDRSYQDRGHQNQGHSGSGQAAAGANQNGQAHGNQANGSQAHGNNGQSPQHQHVQGHHGQGAYSQGQGAASQGQGGVTAGTGGQTAGGQAGHGYDRGGGQRGDGDRGGQQERGARDQGREQGRDYDGRQRGPRSSRPPTEDRQPAEAMNGLPAFITAPTRVSAEPAAQQAEAEDAIATHAGADEEAVHLRPRRRRRSKAEFADRSGPVAADDDAHQPQQLPPAILPDAVGD